MDFTVHSSITLERHGIDLTNIFSNNENPTEKVLLIYYSCLPFDFKRKYYFDLFVENLATEDVNRMMEQFMTLLQTIKKSFGEETKEQDDGGAKKKFK